jgi:prophage regulatory protein
MNTTPDEQPIVFIRLPAVKELTSLSTTKIYEMASQGMFPKQVPLGGRAVAWIKSEVLEWNRAQVARARAPKALVHNVTTSHNRSGHLR